jgi:potassium/hydrogen antiporter
MLDAGARLARRLLACRVLLLKCNAAKRSTLMTTTTDIEHLLLVTSALLLLAVLAGKASARIGIPPLLLFLVVGMLAGSDGPGGIYFNDPLLAQLIGALALAFILFSAGLDTEWPSVRPVLWPGLALSTFGVLLTAALVAWFATLVLRFSWLEGLLLGAIVSATDAAAIFATLRTGAVRLTGRLAPLLEFESGTNDPMAVFLTIGVTQLLTDRHASAFGLIWLFIAQMGIGSVLGLVLGASAVLLINRLRLDVAGLYPVLTTALLVFIYGLTASLHGSGFLAVYLAGLVIGNSRVRERPSLSLFHAGLASLMEIVMFLTLGLLVFPSRLPAIIGAGLLMTLFLTFVARPVSVLASLAFAQMTLREKAFVSWAGLRGAVPIVLATFPLLAGLPNAQVIFDIVFFTVLASVLLQGTTIPLVARWLRVTAPTEVDEPPGEPRAVAEAH